VSNETTREWLLREGTITGRAAEEAMTADFRALAEVPEEFRGCGVIFTEVDALSEDDPFSEEQRRWGGWRMLTETTFCDHWPISCVVKAGIPGSPSYSELMAL
jgi:hypothetical protein